MLFLRLCHALCVAQKPQRAAQHECQELDVMCSGLGWALVGHYGGRGDNHDPAWYAQLDVSERQRGSYCFMWEWCNFVLSFGLVLFCTFKFSVEQLNFPSNCGDDYSHLLASYTSKAIEKMSLLILGDSHFKTMKQFFLSPKCHWVVLICHLSGCHTHRWCPCWSLSVLKNHS